MRISVRHACFTRSCWKWSAVKGRVHSLNNMTDTLLPICFKIFTVAWCSIAKHNIRCCLRLPSWSAAITAMNILRLDVGMWVAYEEARPCGQRHKYLSFFNGYALLGLCVCAAHGNRSKETQRSSEEPEARCCFICSLWSRRNLSFLLFHQAFRKMNISKIQREKGFCCACVCVCCVVRKQLHKDTVTSSSQCLLGLIYEIYLLVNEMEMNKLPCSQ